MVAFFAAAFTVSAKADPVWHCSRNDVQVADASNNFSLAALDAEREVLKVSLRDLYAVYQGETVKFSGVALSACVLGGNSRITDTAMRSIGAHPAALKALSQNKNILSSNIYLVQDEPAMLACIAQHHPAIGYLPTANETEAVGPCF